VVGALLVTVAAVTAFASVQAAQSGPRGTLVVTAREVAPGERLTAEDLVAQAVDLPPGLVTRGYDAVDAAVGAVALAPLAEGDPVLRSAVLDGPPPAGTRSFSFSVDRDRALDGELHPGEPVDVLATYGSGESAVTLLVAGRAPLLRVGEGARGTLGSSGKVTVTIGLTDADQVLQVAHASQVAAVTLVRSAAAADGPVPSEARAPSTTRPGSGADTSPPAAADEPGPPTTTVARPIPGATTRGNG
jgi:Flp pilus assembly protein CpaB